LDGIPLAHRTLNPVVLLAEMRAAQTELGERIDRRPGTMPTRLATASPAADAVIFAAGSAMASGQAAG
jgi:hypothetical protein